MPIQRPADRRLAEHSDTVANASVGLRLDLWVGLVLVIVGAVWATQMRLAQFSTWTSNPAQYMASGTPMMTTLDAYYSLRLARLYAAGTFVPHGPAPQRHYSRPEIGDPSELYDQREPKTLPLLSGAIAVVSRLFGGDIDRTGFFLSPLLSGLFMIPLFLCFWRLGVPAAGLMGALVATFCIDYFQRTGVGWVDTDSLNLFFPWTASCLILAMSGKQRQETLLLLSAAAGAVLYVYYLWYAKAGIALAYAGALAIHLYLSGASTRRILACLATLVVFAGVLQFGAALGNIEDFASRYFSTATKHPSYVAGAMQFPDVWSTIGEERRLRWTDVLARTLGRADMAAIGLLAFAGFALRRWRSMAPLAPVVLLGMLALVSSQRFLFYLAPIVGVGWGVIVSLVVERVWRWSGRFQGARTLIDKPGVQTAAVYFAVIGVFTVAFAPMASWSFVPRPAIPAPVFRDLRILADRLPADSRVWTWWDYGFAIVDVTGFGIYHDGAAQYTPQTNLIAASFVNAEPRVMHDVIRFVDVEGNRGIRRLATSARDFDDLFAGMRRYNQAEGAQPIYVLYTPDMLLKYPAMRTLGALSNPAAAQHGSTGIRWLDCQRIVNDELRCGARTIDLRSGLINGRVASAAVAEPERLRRAVIVEGGRVVREREYERTATLTMELIFEAGAVKAVYLLDEPAFESNLNQMFVLGRFDTALFEEAFNDFPYARAFRVLVRPP